MFETVLATLLSYLMSEESSDKQKDILKSLKPNKKDLTMNVNRTKRGILGDLLKSQSITEKNIKQVGAAKKLPSGAIGTQLEENRGQTNRAITRVTPELENLKIGNNLQYQNMLNQYGQGFLNFQQNKNLTNQAYLGNLSKVFMLWQSGYFNKNNTNPGSSTYLPKVNQNINWNTQPNYQPNIIGSLGG